jgi:two-component system, sensor histidine kinase and response regulator
MTTNLEDEYLRVLLVDDDPALLDALSEALAIRLPATVTETCESGQAALEKLACARYDVVISDVKMPGMDGLELLARVQGIAPDIPVVLITGHGETDLAIRALRAGAYDLIQKPIDRDYMIASLMRAVEARRLRRDLEEKRAAIERYAQELERRVEERTQELQKANRAKDEFLGLVSHELRTPVTVILGNAELLQKRGEDLTRETQRIALADLTVEANRLRRIIENLLVLARLEHGPELETEPVLLRALVAEQIEDHRRAFPAREVLLDASEEFAPVAFAHATHVELILRNLLNNAEKYSLPGTAIEVALYQTDGDVTVSVRDRGRGISVEEAEALFEPFYRSPVTSQSVLGIGIGLSVCRRLIEAHGGRIWAHPRPGGGSDFSFSLPLPAQAMENEDESGAEAPVASSRGTARNASAG